MRRRLGWRTESRRLNSRTASVRLNAQNVPVSQILAEWARRGRTTIVNGERVPGPPVTLELQDVPEQQALDIVLRSVSGYLVAAAGRCDRRRIVL